MRVEGASTFPADGGWRPKDAFQHARAGVAHDGADAFAFLGLVTVVLAFVARGLHVHLAAALGAQHGIGVDARAAGAHGLAAVGGFRSRGRVVIVGAVQRHHLGYGALFAVAAPSDLGAVLLGHVAPPGLDREDTRIQPNAHARFSLESGNADRPRTMPNRTVCAQNLNESDERMFLPIPRSDCAKMSDCTEMIVLR